MIIGIDGNEANVKNRVGSNVYAFQILKGIWKTQNSGPSLTENVKNKKFVIFLKNKPLADMPPEKDWWQYRVLKPEFLWTQWRLPLDLFLRNANKFAIPKSTSANMDQRAISRWLKFAKPKEPIDLFFTPGHYGPRFCPVPLVISIMDLAFLTFPSQFRKKDLVQLKRWTRRSVNQAEKILTISQATKNDIIDYYQVKQGKIEVIYPGMSKPKIQDSKPQSKSKILGKYKIKGKYFLYIGTLQPRKNLVRLIKAFSQSLNLSISQSLNLIIVGKKGWLYEEIFDQVKKLGLEKKVVFTGFVSEKEKRGLLENAFGFVLPSLYEGFGFPVLEAMQAGCPVVVSRVSSLPEVAGEAAVYITNPESVDSIYQALEKMVKLGPKEREELVRKGYQQVKKFSWKKTAEKTLSLLESL